LSLWQEQWISQTVWKVGQTGFRFVSLLHKLAVHSVVIKERVKVL